MDTLGRFVVEFHHAQTSESRTRRFRVPRPEPDGGGAGNGRLKDLTAERISTLQSELRKKRLAESTIAGHLAHLRSALQWAEDVGMISDRPKFKRIRRAKASKGTTPMKGRPITGEEFDRMLAAVPKVVGEKAAPAWCHYLTGLWWSGLRLEESLNLYWDRPDRLCVDLLGPRPFLRVLAEHEKGNKDRLLPITPEFAEFLLATPEAERRGRVFKLPSRKGTPLTKDRVSRIGVEIGEKAGIKVHTHPKTGKVKYASLHDLRRSFGERWSALVMPQTLKELMRHESSQTTERYYVGRNAQTTADAVWAAYQQNQARRSATSGATDQKSAPADPSGTDVNPYEIAR